MVRLQVILIVFILILGCGHRVKCLNPIVIGDTEYCNGYNPYPAEDSTTEPSTDTSSSSTSTSSGGSSSSTSSSSTSSSSTSSGGSSSSTSSSSTSSSSTSSGGIIFVTSSIHDGNLGGVTGANTICQNLATTAGFSGTWKALLSDDTNSIKDLLDTNFGQIYNSKGVVIADTVSDIWSIDLNDVITDDLGNIISNNTLVYTGSFIDGTKDTGHTCSNWTSNSSGDTGTTGDITSNIVWLKSEISPIVCSSYTVRIYCTNIPQ